MKYLMSAEWWKAAGIRAAKTMFQTGAALVVTQMPGGTVDWMAVGSAVIVAGVASLGTSLAGLPELEKGDKVYILENGVIQVYNLYTNEIKAYQIDLKLREGGLYCTDDKLIIVGGYSEGIDGKLGDAGVYEVRLSDFSRTELHLINRE